MSFNLDGSRLFTDLEIDDLSLEDIKILRNQYSLKVLQIDDDFFKRLHVLDYFYNLYDSFSSTPSDFFKKPAYELTIFQSSFLKVAKRFNEILKISYDAPSEFHSDFDMMETYAIVKNNINSNNDAGEESDLGEIEREIKEGRQKRGLT